MAADPAQRRHRGAGLRPLLAAGTRAAAGAGPRGPGRRWTFEQSFQAGKTLTRLDQHQVRPWTSWRRWTILAMLAYSLGLAGLAAAERADNPTPQGTSLIALTCNEIHPAVQHLHSRTDTRPAPPAALVDQATPTSTPRQNQPLPARTSDKRTAGCGPARMVQSRHQPRTRSSGTISGPEQVQFSTPPQVAFALPPDRVSARFMVT